ncbi:hypothetical protein LY78DRAFT_218274 [Colletotrichum sublineola]|nr:hypothetical protein LY78DRAFT_218274 [Colletotrichum sublineola]
MTIPRCPRRSCILTTGLRLVYLSILVSFQKSSLRWKLFGRVPCCQVESNDLPGSCEDPAAARRPVSGSPQPLHPRRARPCSPPTSGGRKHHEGRSLAFRKVLGTNGDIPFTKILLVFARPILLRHQSPAHWNRARWPRPTTSHTLCLKIDLILVLFRNLL